MDNLLFTQDEYISTNNNNVLMDNVENKINLPSTHLPSFIESGELGMSNTKLKPVNIGGVWDVISNDVLNYQVSKLWNTDKSNKRDKPAVWNTPKNAIEFPHVIKHIEKDDVRYFCDWLTYFGQGLLLEQRIEQFLLEQIIEGKFFVNPNSNCKDLLPYQQIECNSQIAPKSPKKWSYFYKNSIGAVLYVGHAEDNRIDALKLDLSGTPLSHLIPRNNLIKLAELLSLLQGVHPKFRCTRFDSTTEVSHSDIDLLELKKYADEGDFCGVKTITPIYENDSKIGLKGLTLNAGSTKSRKRLRIYETTEKHNYHGIRFELQNRSYRANWIANEFVYQYMSAMENERIHAIDKNKLASELNATIRDLIFNEKVINFVDKDSIKDWKSIKDYDEKPMWKKFKEKLEVTNEVVVFAPEKLTNIQKTNNWAFKTWGGLLCRIYLNFGEEGVIKYIKAVLKRKLEGFGVNKYGSTDADQEKLNEVTTFGHKFWTAGFDIPLRKDLTNMGFYSEPLPRKNKEYYPFIEIMNMSLYPTQHRESNVL